MRESGADIVALGEALPARRLHESLKDIYPYSIGCAPWIRPGCSVLVFSRWPLRNAEISGLSEFDKQRLARFSLEVPSVGPVSFRVMHMVKPWQTAFSKDEEEIAHRALADAPEDQPMVLLGDFNAAPWSRRMMELERRHDLDHAPWPVATWPVRAGGLGIPIDHVLLGKGAKLGSLSPWGSDLGSNHRGLLAKIDLPGSVHVR